LEPNDDIAFGDDGDTDAGSGDPTPTVPIPSPILEFEPAVIVIASMLPSIVLDIEHHGTLKYARYVLFSATGRT